MCRRGLLLWRFHRVARDECIESAQVQERIRLSGYKVVTSSPSGARRAETVDQKKQKRSRPQSRQLFEPSGPHHTTAIERANPRWRKPASKLVCVRRGHFESKVPFSIAWITYPIAARHCKKIKKLRSGGQAPSPCLAAGRLHPGIPTGEHPTTIFRASGGREPPVLQA
jgi:hypothetical protein